MICIEAGEEKQEGVVLMSPLTTFELLWAGSHYFSTTVSRVSLLFTTELGLLYLITFQVLWVGCLLNLTTFQLLWAVCVQLLFNYCEPALTTFHPRWECVSSTTFQNYCEADVCFISLLFNYCEPGLLYLRQTQTLKPKFISYLIHH